MENDVTIREVMTREFVGVSEGDSVLSVVQLMREERAGSVLVMRGTETVGILTEWDVLGLVADEGDPATTEAAEVMSSPIISVGPDTGLSECASTMAQEGIRNMVVREAGETLGLLTQRDVIAATGSLHGAANGEPVGEVAGRGGNLAAATTADDRGTEVVGEAFSQQGICEACGALATALWEDNGQLLCSDCRGV